MTLLRRLPKRRPRTAPIAGVEPLYEDVSIIYSAFTSKAEKTAKTYRWCWLVTLAFVGYLVGADAWRSAQPSVAVYTVEVEAGTGVVRVVKPAEQPYDPPAHAIMHQVQEFVKATHGLSIDAEMVGQHWDWAYCVITDKARPLLDAWGQKLNFRSELGKKAVKVDVTRLLRPSTSTVDITWRETTTAEGGQTVKMWSGQYTVAVRTPKNERELLCNPLGIWVDGWAETPL